VPNAELDSLTVSSGSITQSKAWSLIIGAAWAEVTHINKKSARPWWLPNIAETPE
jgi:hypothetical protein